MTDLFWHKHLFTLMVLIVSVCSCSESDDTNPNIPNLDFNETTTGQGLFEFNYQMGSFNKVMRIYYHIPENKSASTPILFVFHGAGRNARDYRNALQSKADQFGFIVITPEFSIQNFPSGDQYNLGNVFVDGDNPSPATLNPESEWTYSIIEPLFDHVRAQINNSNTTYDVFGHSAGAQFAHRFLMFKPNARINKAVISASGWYTFPNTSIVFPYGFKDSPLETLNLNSLFSKQIYVQVGANDNNPNESGLRRNEMADAQGTNRKDRAINFFLFSEQLAQTNNLNFNWNFDIIENTDHNYIPASQNGADLIYN
ncbi:hypothetical protein [Paucihalobacter sp.]|uniref:hypothetical protein n=1 Tax=Paucihalobacter sp. TaxID=2850405 RepID=UPI002FE206FE